MPFQARSVFSKVLCSGIPLKFLASCFGLWPIKKKWQFTIFAIIIIISCGKFALAAYLCVNCYGGLLSSVNYTCAIAGGSAEASRGMWTNVTSSIFHLVAPFSTLLSNCLLFHYSVKSSQRKGVTSFLVANRKIDDLEWFVLNIQIFAICLPRVVVLTLYLVELPTHLFAFNLLQLVSLIGGINMSVACWIFAVITCALRNNVIICYRAIRMSSEGSLDDVIDQHQSTSDHVFSTCRALQPWFVSH